MLRDGFKGYAEASREESGSAAGVATPRRSDRRKLPFGRGGILRVDGRSHIVGVVDISIGGAYLATRTAVSPARALCLKLRLPSGSELSLTCEVLRVSQQTDESQAHPRGIAVRFRDLDPKTKKQLEEFIAIDPRKVAKERPYGSSRA
jgi:hypothetical protein